MKKIYFFIVMLFAYNVAFAQTDLPNGQLENWYRVVNQVNPGIDYDEPGTGPADNWLATLNSLAQIPSSLLGPGPVTAEKTEDAHSGNFAAKLTTEDMYLGGTQTIIIPGMLGTATMVGMGAKLGRPSQGKPLSFRGYYKYEPVNGDSCTAICLVSKWNAGKRDTIGFGKFVTTAAASTYTEFNISVDYSYPSGAEIPDSMTILTISSAGFNVYNFLACQGQVGSKMYVDDLTITYPAGVQQHLMDQVSVKTYPNPATDVIVFETEKNLVNNSLIIVTSDGKTAGTYTFTGKTLTCPVAGLSAGTYFYRIMDGKNIQATGSFSVK